MGQDTLTCFSNAVLAEEAPRPCSPQSAWLRRPARPWRWTRALQLQVAPLSYQHRPPSAAQRPVAPGATCCRAALESDVTVLPPPDGEESTDCCGAEAADDVTARDDVTRVIAAVAFKGKENILKQPSTRRRLFASGSRAREPLARGPRLSHLPPTGAAAKRVTELLRRRRARRLARVIPATPTGVDCNLPAVETAAATEPPAPTLQRGGQDGFVSSAVAEFVVAHAAEASFSQNTSAPFQLACPRRLCPGRISGEQPTSQPLRVAVPASFISAAAADSPDESGLAGLYCPRCDACGALRVRGRWVAVEQLLNSGVGADADRDGWRPVEAAGDRLLLYLLSQHVYGSWERSARRGEHRWGPVPLHDTALLLWNGGRAVGFASLKMRGQLLDGGPEYFVMDVLDVVFVRRSWRRRGYAGRLLLQLLDERPTDRLGLTRPVPAMWRLLCHLLIAHPHVRSRLYLVRWAGSEGFRLNAWQALRGHVAQFRRSDGRLDTRDAVSSMLAGEWPDGHI